MKKSNILIGILVCLSLAAQTSMAAESTPELSIECRMEHNEIYAHEPVSVVLTLISSIPDIAFVKRPEQPLTLKKGEFDTFQVITPAGDAYEEKIGGRTFYCFPLDAYMISMAEKGKYELTGGDYQIGIYFYGMATDQLGRRVKARKLRQFNIPVEKKTFKVKNLPTPPTAMQFSGSVGQFDIETIVPAGDIFVDEEATAYVVLRGSGMVAESTLPEYRNAFHKGVKLKSVSESRDEGHVNGKMMTEIRLDCTFIPTSREDAEIGVISFDYFDPLTGKYATAKTDPVKITVKSTTAKRENIAV